MDFLSLFSDWGSLLLRVAFGVIFLAHGWPKLKNLSGTGQWLNSEGFKPGIFWAAVLAILEVFGSLAIILGVYVQIVAVFFAIEMITAIFWRLKKGEKLIGGYEFDLILLAVALFLATNGPGIYTLL